MIRRENDGFTLGVYTPGVYACKKMEKSHGELFVFHIFLYVKIARGPWQILGCVNPQAHDFWSFSEGALHQECSSWRYAIVGHIVSN